jgi:hypothetical protein
MSVSLAALSERGTITPALDTIFRLLRRWRLAADSSRVAGLDPP